ncbi:MAG TPA: universal stress protein, partial [Xanthobacteraceae bacterium]|nr:universal stress protein [Xanthobacteraceae bacterium]
VQPEPEDWRLRGYGSFKRTEIRERLIEDLGRPIVLSVARKLKARGIRHRMRVEIGDPAGTVVRVAAEENCKLIVLPEPRANNVTRWLARNAGISLGSVTAQIIGLSEIPVLVAK